MSANEATTHPHDQYWATVPEEDLASQMRGRIHDYFEDLHATGRLNILRRSMAAYYGQDPEGRWHNSATLHFGGDQGEIIQSKANHYRSLVQHILVMATQDRPAFDARAVNNDSDSATQTALAEGLLEYYLTEKRIEDRLIRAAELALVCSEGWVSCTWDHDAGEDAAAQMPANDNGQGQVVKGGDVRVEFHEPWNVIRNCYEEPEDLTWVILKRSVNKWDLVASYAQDPEAYDQKPDPEQEELRTKILNAGRGTDQDESLRDWAEEREVADMVSVYELYHGRTAALPSGRHSIMVGDVILFDGPLPYEGVPVHGMIPSVEIGAGTGYAGAWDLLALQELYDSVISTVASNHDAFGTQNILIPDGSNLDVTDLQGGLRALNYNAAAGEPKALQLLQSGEGSFKFADLLRGEMEVLSGVNKVARGEPPPQLKSGSALAMVQSMAIQYNSGVQRTYARLLEAVGTGIIRVLQQYAHTPRIAEIVGRDQRAALKKFTSDSVKSVRRVVVDVGNPVMRTTAGKVDLADRLLDKGLIKQPEQYFQVLETGRMDPVTQRPTSQISLIKAENEALSDGKPAKVLITDLHHLHIEEHLTALDSPEVRMDDRTAGAILMHIQEHIQQRQAMDPVLAELTGQMPLESMAMMGPPPGPGGAPSADGPPPPANDNGAAEAPEDAQANAPDPGTGDLPQMPVNPMTGERMPPAGA